MVDSVVSFLLENLSRLLNDEIKLLSGVEEKVDSLYNELKFIDIFLKSSQGKRSDAVVKEVVSQIRDVAYKAEDVVDTYVAKIAKHKYMRNKIYKLFHLRVLHEVNTDIDKIRNRIDDIYKNKKRYGIEQGEFQSQDFVGITESLRKKRRDVEEQDIVGLVHDSNVIIQQLKESDLRLKVVSIIGMGGLGKTTLARKIYNNNQVKELFPCRAWGYLSTDYRPKEFFLSLFKCLRSSTSDCDNLSDEDLKKMVAEELKEKKYLIVLDDIWKPQVWDEVKDAFPDDKTGSRILITSQINEVAHYTGTTSPYNLPVLNKDESWVLFCNKVFRGEKCPSDLVPLGKSIVENCSGLPLAIVVLAGLVAKKEKSEREWKRIKDVNLHPGVKDILKLSYDNLPPKLKPCFLYFGIYPEDYEISVREVIQLWIAEGFIKKENQNATEELEDVGDKYLDDMVDRNLVQVAKRRSDGGVKTCRIHDLLRNLCISECISENFLEVCTVPNINTISSINSRRLSFHCQLPCDMKYVKPCIRSVFFFLQTKIDYNVKSFKLARVLHSKTLGFSSQPNKLKRMIHLRYLKILFRGDLPASISCLWNLETLYVHDAQKISSEIWKLKQLRHLHLSVRESPKASGERVMENLQTLWLRVDDKRVISTLQNVVFPRLRKLTLFPKFFSGEVCYPLEELSNLPSLTNLQSLNTLSNVVRLTDSNVFPSNLTKIILRIISPVESHIFMNTLGALPNLQILKLIGYSNQKCWIDIDTGKFLQLQVFHIRGLNIYWRKLGKDVMSNLRHLVIEKFSNLFEIPEQLLSLTTLRVVHLVDCLYSFVRRVELSPLNKDCKLIIDNH